jgi:hypothetical protein
MTGRDGGWVFAGAAEARDPQHFAGLDDFCRTGRMQVTLLRLLGAGSLR